ncbi:MAG: ABC transporter substrate-binding protein [Chloroflexota bacterium]
MRNPVRFFHIAVVALIAVVFASSGVVPTTAQDELIPVRLALTPFQDMLSIQVGVEQGFYEQVGIDLQLLNVPYETVTEILAAGEADLSAMCETTIVTVWDTFPKQRIANIFYTFEGSAIMVRPGSGFKPYLEFLSELGDPQAAMNATVAQLKGKDVLTTKGSDMEMGVAAALRAGGLDISDVNIIDMNPDDGLAAFLAGTGDAFLGGLPHRFRLVKEGMQTLVTAQDVGSEAVVLCGFSATEDYVEDNFDTLVDFTRGTFLTMQYVNANQDAAFGRITELLNSYTGAQMTIQDIKNLWNRIEFFPTTGAEMYWLLVSPQGARYWRPRMEFVYEFYSEQGLVRNSMDYDEVFSFGPILEAYMAKYEPDAWAVIQK